MNGREDGTTAGWLAAHQRILERKSAAKPVPDALTHTAAIIDVLTSAAVYYDAGNIEGLLSVFAPDATYRSFLGTYTGHDELRANFEPLMARYERAAHYVANSTVWVTSESAAQAVSYAHAIVQTRDGVAYAYGGSYEDRLSRTPDGWKLTSRIVHDGLAYRIDAIPVADRLPPAH